MPASYQAPSPAPARSYVRPTPGSGSRKHLRPTATDKRTIRKHEPEARDDDDREDSEDSEGREGRGGEEGSEGRARGPQAERERAKAEAESDAEKDRKDEREDDDAEQDHEHEGRGYRGGPARYRAFSRSTLTILVVAILVTAGLWWGLNELMGDDEPAADPDYLLVVWAMGLDRPTSLTAGPEGSLFVGQSSSPGKVRKLWESNGNITGSEWVPGTSSPMGLVWSPTGWLYVSHRGRLSAYRDSDGDEAVDRDVTLIDDLPTDNEGHLNNGIALGADGYLYLTVGSTCNACPEPDERSATILRVDPGNGNYTVHATGLRNSLDLALHAGSGELYAVDNQRTDKEYPEELNIIVEDGDYGWPNATGGTVVGTTGPVATFPAHSKPWGLVFTPDSKFTGHAGDAIVALNALGKVVSVNLTFDPETQEPVAQVQELVTGLESPTDLTFGTDGALYIADSKLGQVLKLTRL